MSKKSAGLFGSKPDLLLVDERPPGIQLPSLDAAPPTPLEEEEEDEQVDFTDEDDALEDEDSYDGDGPLRIFIGAPKKEGEPEKPAASVADLAPGPVWDASALAAGDEFEDDVEETPDDVARGPILVRPDKAPAEPPPLTMSFGGSFSRGSMDAGVMDAEGEVIGGDLPRRDTVVVHDQIYDRFLSLDEPAAPPVRAHEDAGDSESADELLAVGSADEEEALAAGDAEETIDMPSSVEDGPPPTRLRVGFVPGEADEDDPSFLDEGLPVGAPDPFRLDDDEEDEAEDDSYSASVALGDPGEDAGESPSKIGALLGLDDSDLPEAPSLDGIPAIDSDAVPTLPEDPVEPSAPRTEVTETVAPSAQDDWAERRRAAQQAMALPEPPAPAEEDEGGRAGTWIVVIFVAIILAIAAAWAWQQSQTPAAPSPPPTDTPTELTPGSDAGPAPEAPAGDAQGDAAAPAGDAADAAAADAADSDAAAAAAAADGAAAEPPAAETAAAPAPGADAMPAEGSVDAALGGDDQPTGVLRIRSSRTARVYVDGEYLGQTPMAAIDLPGGTHEIRVIAIDSGRTRTQTVRVDVGRSQEVRFSF